MQDTRWGSLDPLMQSVYSTAPADLATASGSKNLLNVIIEE